MTYRIRRTLLLIALLLIGGLSAAQPIRAAQTISTVESLVPEIISKRPHDTTAFTEGLIWDNGVFYESSGLTGKSNLREVDPLTGKVIHQVALSPRYFGEGIALVGTKLIQMTWTDQIAFVYDRDTFQPLGTLSYEGQGWGLCNDGQQLYMSNGSDQITERDPQTFAVIRTIPVTLNGQPVKMLNSLECHGSDIYANVWLTDNIVRIDKATGQITALIDAAGLLTASERLAAGTDGVLNGIAYDPQTQTFFITGKLWPWMFEVLFVPASPII